MRIGKPAYLAGSITVALLVVVALLLLTGHIGLGHAVAAHGLQTNWCNGIPGPCAPPA